MESIVNGRGPAGPEGLWDMLPERAKARRALEARLRSAFEKRGYGEVICPTFEYFENLAAETGPSVKDDMVRFLGRDGRLLALRPEMTTAIARVVAQRYAPRGEPRRLYYITNVFRESSSMRGQPREFWQAGAECIGAAGPEYDAQILALFIETLLAAGLRDFKVGLGRIDFLTGALEALRMTEAEEDRLRAALAAKSLVEYERVVGGMDIPSITADRLLALPGLSGGEEVFAKAAVLDVGPAAEAALADLAGAYKMLYEEGYGDMIVVDLGIVRDFDYYTGIVFEAYTPALGAVLGGGGRYDNLLAEFGDRAPAAGFALGLERLEQVL